MSQRKGGRTRAARRAGEKAAVYGLALRVVGELGEGAVVPSEGLSIGSGEGCDLRVVDPYVSKQHCTVLWRGGELFLRDEESRNGTWVNNVSVSYCRLRAGARIDLGRTRLQVLRGGAMVQKDGKIHGLVGSHRRMREVYKRIDRFAVGSFPVLISGETGTGKELVARAIHESSRVAAGPFEAINCAAIPRELAESELFGHVRGAFTGAVNAFSGAFQRAEGGTLFLDEIGEMPLELQPKLLRVLEDGLVRPVGSEVSFPMSVRLVAASHRELAREAGRGRFRLDLFYRLAVGHIELPALRNRASDIPLLVRHFLAAENSSETPLRLERGLLRWLSRQPWPGNVRALRHAVQRAVALVEGGRLAKADFAESLTGPTVDENSGALVLRGKDFSELKSEIFRWALGEHGTRALAAEALGIAKSTFNDQIRLLGI